MTENEVEAVTCCWLYEHGQTMFHLVNGYTRAAMFHGLLAAANYRLQAVGGQILAMVK
jgi:hypothetical protein